MRSFPLTVLKGGINRLRVKGGASANQLYDLQNGYITNDGSIAPREGTIRTTTLDSSTVGLAAANGQFNIFSSAFSTATLTTGYILNVLSNPHNTSSNPTKILFAKPFMGFEYVVASFSSGDIVHYWLQNNGVWASNTVYLTTSDIILPPVANGLAYQAVRDFPAQPSWTPETNIALGAYVEPNTATGFAYQAVSIAGFPNGCLFHFDGTSGSTVFPDASGYGQLITAHGNAAVSAIQAKFGNGSLTLTSQTTDYVDGTIATGGPIDISLGDSTIECWFFPVTNPNGAANYDLFSLGQGTSAQISVGGLTTGSGVGNKMDAAAFSGSSGGEIVTSLTPNAWNHVALSIQGANAFAFCNGVQYSTFAVGVRSSVVNRLVIGQQQSGAGGGAWGFVDEFRITKGTALYTANFTPPTAAFSATSPFSSHTGAVEPVWPTLAGGITQEFGDFDTSASDAGTTQATTNSPYSTASPLGTNITDRYGNSSTIANSGIFTTSSAILASTTLASTKITTWVAGTNYATGAVVIPTSAQGAFVNAIPNGDFEGGSAAGGWTFTDPGGLTQWAFSTALPYQGSECVTFPGGGAAAPGAGGAFATMTSYGLVTPGQSVTASAYLDPNNAGANLTLWLQLNWYDVTDTIISSSGHAQNEQEGGGYRPVSITAVAPANAAHVRVSIGAGSGTTSRNAGFADLVSWNLETAAPITNFLFEAVQPAAGTSLGTEPVWPTTLGGTVIDGGVTWKAIGTSIITWQAIPLMKSGPTAPTFPTVVGNTVADPSTYTNINGSITTFCSMSWQCVDRHIADPNCPNTAAVAIGASHVFNGSNDIVSYSAAVNPTDWTSTNNAGYLPTGLNNYGDNPVMVIALYRGNLVVFNASGYQMWQIDPDPQNMALLDAQPVGSLWPQATQSVANDLLFLAEVGVRNLGTVGPTANLAIGNTGQPIDPLVLAQIQAATYVPISIYYPARGQYWLIYGPLVFVLTMNGSSQKTWSRYIFPAAITDATLNAGFMYLRTATNVVWQLNAQSIGVDDANTITTAAAPVAFNGVIQWPYLDLSMLGVNKMLVGVDIVGEGNCSIQIAYNQNDKTTFNDNAGFATSTGVTTPYFVQIDDTVPGEPLAIPINAPSYSPILTFTGSTSSANAWSWDAMNIYFMPAPSGAAGATG